MADNPIRWKRGDYIRLGQAVAQFNSKIQKLENELDGLYLPDKVSYKDQKEQITTRRELNRFINSLRRFSREGAEDLYITEAGEELTQWERQEIGIQKRTITRRLNQELKELNLPLETGYSRVQMGSTRARAIQAQLKNLNKIESFTGYEFQRLKQRIQQQGTADYEMRKAIVFRENYINEMKKYSHFDNYEQLIAKMESIKNPLDFYNTIKNNELLVDLTYQSDQYYSQMEFTRFVEDWGAIDLEDTI